MMDNYQFHWPDAQFLNTGSPQEPAADYQMPTHDYNTIGPWSHQGNVAEMQPGEMDWGLYDSQPSNLSLFLDGPPAAPAHSSNTIHGATGYMNHQPADVLDGVPTPQSYGRAEVMSPYLLSEQPTIHSTAYEPAALAGQAEALGGSDEGDGSSDPRDKSRPNAVGLEDDNWTYAVEVRPAIDYCAGRHVVQHVYAVQRALNKKPLDYDLTITAPVEDCRDICRRYTLPRRFRDNDRVRLEFLQVFSTNKAYNIVLPNYRFKMSVVYENRNFLSSSSPYPPNLGASDHGDEAASASSRYSPNPMQDLVQFNQLHSRDDPTLIPPSPESPHDLLAPPTPPGGLTALVHVKADPEGPTPPRMKPIPKPDREVMKNRDGKYCCTWPNCTDEVKQFSRKCEWSKHMDKHDRPYKCPSGGCEKLPGFTYSGGLLRHEREVHGKHGGPKNPLNCPHVNCKRHTGKGFSRLENLNEHLRRVHTADAIVPAAVEEPEDGVGSSVAPASPKPGEKRKPDGDLRDEVKRLQVENQDLRSQVEAQKRQQMAMMQQMQDLQETLQNFTNTDRAQQRFTSGSPAAATMMENGGQQVSQSF